MSKNSFNSLLTIMNQSNNTFSKRWRPSGVQLDPLVTGYFFINFKTKNNDMRKCFDTLRASCLSVMTHGSYLNKIEHRRSIGTDTFQYNEIIPTKENLLTLQFLESVTLPIKNALDEFMIYKKPIDLYYWTTEPNGKNLTYCCKYKNVKIKENDALANLRSCSLANIDKVYIHAFLSFDEILEGDEITEKCKEIIINDWAISI